MAAGGVGVATAVWAASRLATTTAAAAAGLTVSGPMPLPAGSPQQPPLAALLPASEHALSEDWVRLSGPVPQVVVSTVDRAAASGFGTASDLVVFAWDSFAKRWVSVFDAAKVPPLRARRTAPISEWSCRRRRMSRA